MRVLIVGGGIAGHTLGMALKKRNIACEIVELRKNWKIVGAGMYVQNNALRALDDIGIAHTVVNRGWHSEDDTSSFADLEGNLLATVTVPKFPDMPWPGTNPIERKVLHDILSKAAQQAQLQITMRKTVVALQDDPVADRIEVGFDDGTNDFYDLVVGADGIRSSVRQIVFPDAKPEYSGFSNWRIILPRPDGLNRVVWQVGEETSVGIIPISDTSIYLGCVSKEPGNPWFEPDTLLKLVRERFRDYRGMVGELIAQIQSPDQIVYTPIEEVSLPRPWSKGRVVLIGDAAHASTPFWANGASMAIEDAVLLAQLLSDGGELSDILEQWEKRRYPRCIFVQEGSKRAGVATHTPTPLEHKYDYIRAHAQDDLTHRYTELSKPI